MEKHLKVEILWKTKVETTALSIKHIAQMYYVNGKYFADLYRNRLSGYAEWHETELGCGFYFNAPVHEPRRNMSEQRRGVDISTNKEGHGGKGTLAAAIPGSKSEEIISILIGTMGKSVRWRV
ncbi:hypothetical protein [Parabacteroides sp.]